MKIIASNLLNSQQYLEDKNQSRIESEIFELNDSYSRAELIDSLLIDNSKSSQVKYNKMKDISKCLSTDYNLELDLEKGSYYTFNFIFPDRIVTKCFDKSSKISELHKFANTFKDDKSFKKTIALTILVSNKKEMNLQDLNQTLVEVFENLDRENYDIQISIF
ncbi:MAG: hypothetical protein MHPSP_000465 [Paramarteilia canceri]